MLIHIVHTVTDKVHDFGFHAVDTEIMASLIGALGFEYQKRLSAAAAPSFRMERALQHERHLAYCKANQQDPKQNFIDFPL
jgi:hypothetical protein